jgi:hypothetical protein
MATSDKAKPLFAVTEAEAIQCLRERGYVVAGPCASRGYNERTTPATANALHSSSSQPVYGVTGEVSKSAASHHKTTRGESWTHVQAPGHPITPICKHHDDTV